MTPVAFKVAELVDELRAAGLLRRIAGELPEWISGVTDDSRYVAGGEAFVALPGLHADGHDFLFAARERGARMALVERGGEWPLPAVVVADARSAAAIAAAVAYGRPADRLRLAAVTGTNGKTTTVDLARAVLHKTVCGSASIGTLGAVRESNGAAAVNGTQLTTPGPVELQKILRSLADSGVECVAIEVSSHSLAQRRVEGLSFEAAAFTTFTRDHLDYHGSMEAYYAAKAALVDRVAADGTVIINGDDPAWERLPSLRRTLAYGTSPMADIRADGVHLHARGSEWRLRIGGESARVRLPLIGAFNVGNALAAAGIAYAMGARTVDIAAVLSVARQVPGRLEVLRESPLVLRDYAHTPDALERALAAARLLANGRLIVVFGCGGDRDQGKRPVMGAVAAECADRAIVTSDNPRTEDPDRIIDDIIGGMPTGSYERLVDRREAIARALDLAEPEDVVLIAGKGHETYQIRGSARLPFDEKEIVNELLSVRS